MNSESGWRQLCFFCNSSHFQIGQPSRCIFRQTQCAKKMWCLEQGVWMQRSWITCRSRPRWYPSNWGNSGWQRGAVGLSLGWLDGLISYSRGGVLAPWRLMAAFSIDFCQASISPRKYKRVWRESWDLSKEGREHGFLKYSLTASGKQQFTDTSNDIWERGSGMRGQPAALGSEGWVGTVECCLP